MPFSAYNIDCPQRRVSILAVRKTGAGTPVLSGLCANFCSIVDNGAGDYTIAVNTQQPFVQDVIATALPHSPGVMHIDIATSDNLAISVKCFDVDGTTPAELDFDLICMGSTSQDLNG